ncbi:MAG: phosphohydrolase [Geobacteraceae bacterium GWC2_48_7]|nr:MAG: phosphohydrolase [Geobacteraceae bacterium GWC2_48_7]
MEKQRRDESKLKLIMELAASINSSLDPVEIQQLTVEAATRCVGADAASLLLLDQETGELYFEVSTGEKRAKLKEIRLKPGQGIAGWIVRRGGAMIIDDVQNHPRFYRDVDNSTGYETRSMLISPVASKERIWGVLQALNKIDGSFTDEDLEMLEALSDMVGTAIEKAMLHQELQETFLGIIMAFAGALEKRDSYTGGHTKRVCSYSLATGYRLDLNQTQLDELKLSAILHDIGKIGVSDKVLQKNGKLEPEEFAEMKSHPELGAEIMEHVKSLRTMLAGVRPHHEKFDGTGYPDRIKGSEIPLTARIIAVADTFDAMTSNRPYRTALSHETALKELKAFAGIQFDPEVVEAFIAAYQDGEIDENSLF